MATPTLRTAEYPHLDTQNQIYLDYTGSNLAPLSLLQSHFSHLQHLILGNPHSANPTSQLSTTLIDQTRAEILSFFNADPLKYSVIFTANATAAIKLVAESYPFRRNSTFALLADNHNSINGIRQFAKKASANVFTLPLTDDLRVTPDLPQRLRKHASRAPSLFAYPAQSNFSGVKHPLALVAMAQQLGYDVFLDASAYVPSSALDIGRVRPDFVCVSFYKMFGFPTGVGCLIARNDKLAKLQRPWYAGGAVQYVSVQNDMHMLAKGHEGFEDGTLNFGCVPAVMLGLRFLRNVGMDVIESHVERMTWRLLQGVRVLRYANGGRMVRVYGPETMERRGGTVNLDVLDEEGNAVDARLVEMRANERNISVRTGCFCNPGAAERAFGMGKRETKKCVKMVADDFSVERFSKCMGEEFVGSVRVSVGIATNQRDVDTFLLFLRAFAMDMRKGGEAGMGAVVGEWVKGVDFGRERGEGHRIKAI